MDKKKVSTKRNAHSIGEMPRHSEKHGRNVVDLFYGLFLRSPAHSITYE